MRDDRGFTLIELLVAVALAVILLGLGVPSFRDHIQLQRLKSANAQLVTDLQYARTEAAARNAFVRVRVQQDDAKSCYVLYIGAEHACSCLASPVCPADGSATELRSVELPRSEGVLMNKIFGQSADEFRYDPATGGIYFTPSDARGADNFNFKVDAQIDGARWLRTVVTQSGRPSVCAPSGSTMHVDACHETSP